MQAPLETHDIVLDILQRVQAIFEAEQALTQAHFEQIAREVKADWCGERPYISKNTHLTTQFVSSRRRDIIRMVRAGESFSFIGRHFGISRQRAYQIYKGD